MCFADDVCRIISPRKTGKGLEKEEDEGGRYMYIIQIFSYEVFFQSNRRLFSERRSQV